MEPTGGRSAVSQLRRGVLEYCVLALLSRHKQLYGFDLVRRLSELPGMVTSEGTVYPLLTRLRRAGWVDTEWVESQSGPPRRYYALTMEGATALKHFANDWRAFRTTVDDLLHEGQP